MARYTDTLRDQNGAIVAGGLITVLRGDGTTPVLTDDDDNVLSQPLVSDRYGTWYFNASDSRYDFFFYYGGRTRLIERGVVVGVPGYLDVKTIADTSYTLVPTDENKLLRFTANSPVTLIGPRNFGAGWACGVLQRGTGSISFEDSDGNPITNEFGLSSTYGPKSISGVLVDYNADGLTADWLATGSLV